MSAALLVNQIEAVPTRWTAAELQGRLAPIAHYAGYSLADLETTVSDLSESVFNSRFEAGWAALTWLAKQDLPKVSDRIHGLEKLADGARMARADLRDWVRVGRAFEPDLVKPYQDKPWTWFVEIASRTRYAGPIGSPERTQEIAAVAEETAEETCAETRAALERRKSEALGRGAFLETDDGPEPAPHPATTEAPPQGATVFLRPLTADEQRFLRVMTDAYRADYPGTVQLMVLMIGDELRRGWKLTEATP